MAIKTGDSIAASNFNLTGFSFSLSHVEQGGQSAYCVGPVCVIVIDRIYNGSTKLGGSVDIGTIPDGYRPAHSIRAMVTRNYYHGLLLGIETNGTIKAYSIQAGDIITGQIVYFRQ